MHRLILAALLALTVAGCQRLTGEQCDRLCWRYNEIAFWERFEAEAGRLAPAEREKLRAERQAVWNEMKARKFDPMLENCLRDCRRSASPEVLACVERAKTSEQAAECVD